MGNTILQSQQTCQDCRGEGYIIKNEDKINATVVPIIWKGDVMTQRPLTAVERWSHYAVDVRPIEFLKAKTHYFQNTHADEIVDIIIKEMAKEGE